MHELGVDILTGKNVTDIQPGYVVVGQGPDAERFESLVTLWAAGVQASPLGKMLGIPVNRKGSVTVDQYLNPPGLRNVFICGDLADVTEHGKPIPGVAQPAMQMGRQAAHMIEADMEGRTRKPFHYFDKGDMATIGRHRAVADVKWPVKGHWSGFLAWITWLTVHIFFLIGFRNRVLVMVQWAWTYLTSAHGARLIMGNQRLPGWNALVPARKPVRVGPLDLASPADHDLPEDQNIVEVSEHGHENFPHRHCLKRPAPGVCQAGILPPGSGVFRISCASASDTSGDVHALSFFPWRPLLPRRLCSGIHHDFTRATLKARSNQAAEGACAHL